MIFFLISDHFCVHITNSKCCRKFAKFYLFLWESEFSFTRRQTVSNFLSIFHGQLYIVIRPATNTLFTMLPPPFLFNPLFSVFFLRPAKTLIKRDRLKRKVKKKKNKQFSLSYRPPSDPRRVFFLFLRTSLLLTTAENSVFNHRPKSFAQKAVCTGEITPHKIKVLNFFARISKNRAH